MATWPHEFLVNEQDKLPVSFERHAEDIKSLGPEGSFYTNEEHATLRFGDIITEFERDNSDPAKYVRLSGLLRLCCSVTGACYTRARAHNPVPNSPEPEPCFTVGRPVLARVVAGVDFEVVTEANPASIQLRTQQHAAVAARRKAEKARASDGAVESDGDDEPALLTREDEDGVP